MSHAKWRRRRACNHRRHDAGALRSSSNPIGDRIVMAPSRCGMDRAAHGRLVCFSCCWFRHGLASRLSLSTPFKHYVGSKQPPIRAPLVHFWHGRNVRNRAAHWPGPSASARAVFRGDRAAKFSDARGMLIELFAAVPSVVFGLWGLFVLAPVMRTVVEPALRAPLAFFRFPRPFYGVGMLTGGILLAIMVLPTVVGHLARRLRGGAGDQREAMIALGATKWEVLSQGGAAVRALRRDRRSRARSRPRARRSDGGGDGHRQQTGNFAASLFSPGYTMASVLAHRIHRGDRPTVCSRCSSRIGSMLFL